MSNQTNKEFFSPQVEFVKAVTGRPASEERMSIAEKVRINQIAMAWLAPMVETMLGGIREGLETSLSSEKRAVVTDWLRYSFNPTRTNWDNYQHCLKPTHFFKTEESANKKLQGADKDPSTLTDLTRFTLVYPQPLCEFADKTESGLDVLVEDTKKIIEKMHSIGGELIEVDAPVNANLYSHVVLKFRFQVAPGVYKIVECQINTKPNMQAKKAETPIFDERKHLAIRLSKINEAGNIRPKDIDPIIRQMLDKNLIDKDGNVLEETRDSYYKIVNELKDTFKIPKENLYKQAAFMNLLQQYIKAFCKSYNIYLFTQPVIQTPEEGKEFQRVINQYYEKELVRTNQLTQLTDSYSNTGQES